ncbi:hypothetical protein EDB80DRAFT_683266 [Ilyonectria destructans]|nr:hypothetical protein EDB80DRAFT_683266 [Ilyonectria destructans]
MASRITSHIHYIHQTQRNPTTPTVDQSLTSAPSSRHPACPLSEVYPVLRLYLDRSSLRLSEQHRRIPARQPKSAKGRRKQSRRLVLRTFCVCVHQPRQHTVRGLEMQVEQKRCRSTRHQAQAELAATLRRAPTPASSPKRTRLRQALAADCTEHWRSQGRHAPALVDDTALVRFFRSSPCPLPRTRIRCAAGTRQAQSRLGDTGREALLLGSWGEQTKVVRWSVVAGGSTAIVEPSLVRRWPAPQSYQRRASTMRESRLGAP